MLSYYGLWLYDVQPTQTKSMSNFDALWKKPAYISDDKYEKWIIELQEHETYKRFIDNFYHLFYLKDLSLKQMSNLNQTDIPFDRFVDMITEICTVFDIDIEDFLQSFNKLFRYHISDFNSESLHQGTGLITVNEILQVDVNNLSKDDLQFIITEAYTYPYNVHFASFKVFPKHDFYDFIFLHNIETLFLQFWYEQQSGKKEERRVFAERRKLSWLDFDYLIIKKLDCKTIENMIDMLWSIKELNSSEFHIEEYGEHYAQTIFKRKENAKTLEELFNEDRVNECDQFLRKYAPVTQSQQEIFSKLSRGVQNIIKEISEELKLIQMISKLNEMIIEEDKNVDNVINVMLGKINKNDKRIDQIFEKLSYHPRCLFQQILLSSYINMLSKTDQQYSSFYTKLIMTYVPQLHDWSKCPDCPEYYACHKQNDQALDCQIYCYHKTFHYYSFSRWMYLYDVMMQKFSNDKQKLSVWYPKEVFCNRCYTQYKNYEEVLFNQSSRLNTS